MAGCESRRVKWSAVRSALDWMGERALVKMCVIAVVISSGVTEEGDCESFFRRGEIEMGVCGGGGGAAIVIVGRARGGGLTVDAGCGGEGCGFEVGRVFGFGRRYQLAGFVQLSLCCVV